MNKRKIIFSLTAVTILAFFLAGMASAKESAKIIHDAEYGKVLKQHGDAWASEDKELEKRLAELEAKHGKKPNIIYFMWDDAAYGRVGHPMLS